MPEKKVVDWFTMNGKHIPIFEGESKESAYQRAISSANDDIRAKQIAENRAQADRLNRKSVKRTYSLFHGSPNADITELDIAKAGKNTSTGEKFLFFTDSREMADEFSYERLETSSKFINKKGKKGKVYDVDVTMSNPLDLTHLSESDISNLIALSDGELDSQLIDKLSKGNNQLLKAYIDLNKLTHYGYDGFIAKMDNKGNKEYAVVDNKQVKIRR